MPALCYVLLIGGIPEIHSFNPCTIVTILLITGFSILIGSFDSERLSCNFFTVSMLISLATLFYQYMYVYMLVVWCVLIFWRPGYWRELVFSILGFALPLFFAFGWFFLVDDDVTLMNGLFNEIFDIQYELPSLSAAVIVFSAITATLLVVTFGYTLRYITSRKTTIRTGYYVMMLIAAITIGLAFAIPDIFPQAWYILAFPVSFTISCYLANAKSQRFGTVVLAALFLCVLITQVIFLSAE
jgi:uncharacterized membrane protein